SGSAGWCASRTLRRPSCCPGRPAGSRRRAPGSRHGANGAEGTRWGGPAGARADDIVRSVRMYRTGFQGIRFYVLIDDFFEALPKGPTHPAVAAWLGLGTAAVAAVVVAMA